MWYADAGHVLYATSQDGVHWERPILNIAGKNNQTNLTLHSPSICDRFEPDPQRRYKAVAVPAEAWTRPSCGGSRTSSNL